MPKFLRSKWFLSLLAVVLLLGAGGTYYYTNNVQAAQVSEEPDIQTSSVRQGDIVVSATGAGTVIPAEEVNLGFRNSGILAELAVQVGDKIEAGAVLARLDDTDSRAQMAQAEISLRETELQLQQLLGDPDPAALASAQSGLTSAQSDLTRLTAPPSAEDLSAARDNLLSAKQALNLLLAGPTSDEAAAAKADVDLASINVQKAQADYDKVSWRPDVGTLPQARALQEATIAYEKAVANYDLKTAGASADQFSAARAKVSQAQAQLDTLENGADAEDLAAAEAKLAQAQAQLDVLLDGATEIEAELAQLKVEQARNNLASAQTALDNTTLLAPIAGVITAVSAQTGENSGTGAIISLADLDQPLLEIFLDETDLDKVGAGYEVEVVFDAFPDDTFIGRVEQVDPSLTMESGTSVVRALVRLDESSFAKPLVLPIGLNATVEVIGGRATNAMLIPVEALREISPGQYAVFVMKDGEPALSFVEVGLMDFSFAEIISGLERGDVVTTGIVETK